ncbi:HlyD family efflux transporter periplasmic adaptor subunit [Desulfosporosinus sp.]|uniref:HlyD family secretion protein n=1 Tax=Desulfosporosinus sp. TaxID=157907 RepID=UPI0025B9129E|nr:HlyD family efflux transporter periplasmic adaptor subunit [Desulfosporosinus sp.]MBC2721453.1 HlyD family efflux transporter periplasmic adaptor subunit [Desulfosporosinus sp.]MBC2727509.1 HlyD family efflux transporter periplasmic adaptor subunit [Desulfosporosinus sp.]
MRKKAVVMVIVLIFIALSVIGDRYLNRSKDSNVFSGTIEGTELPVQSELGGRVVDLLVSEGQVVKVGDIIAKLDDSQAKISLAIAKSQHTQAQAKLNDLLGGARAEEIRRLEHLVSQAKANLSALEPSLKFEEDNLAANLKLYESGAISKQVVDTQRTKLDTLKAQYQSAQASVDATQASLDQAQAGYTQPMIQAQKAAVDIAAQSIKTAELGLSKLTLKSPASGQVLYQNVELGQVVNLGSTLATILDPNDLWIKVYVPGAKLSQIKMGGTVSIAADAYPDKTFKGQIQYISTQAEFTPKNVQTKEERTTTVYAVKIGITDTEDQLKAGMPADITLE